MVESHEKVTVYGRDSVSNEEEYYITSVLSDCDQIEAVEITERAVVVSSEREHRIDERVFNYTSGSPLKITYAGPSASAFIVRVVMDEIS